MAVRRRNPLTPGGGGTGRVTSTAQGGGSTPRRTVPASPRTSNFGAWRGNTDPRHQLPSRPAPAAPTPAPVTPAAPPPQRPQYTPGSLDAQGLSELADRGLNFTTRMSDIGRRQAALNARSQADLVRSGQVLTEDMRNALRNAAARGATRSGIRAFNEEAAQAANLGRVGDINRGWTSGSGDLLSEALSEQTSYNTDVNAINREGGRRDFDAWKANTGDQFTPAPTPESQSPNAPAAPRPTWAEFRRTHPGAKTPAQVAALRAKYRKRFGAP